MIDGKQVVIGKPEVLRSSIEGPPGVWWTDHVDLCTIRTV